MTLFENQIHFSHKYRNLLIAASVALYFFIVIGGVIRVTGSGLGCQDWLTCYGDLLQSLRVQATIAYAYGLVGIVGALLVLVVAAEGVRRFRNLRVITIPLVVALLLLGVQALLVIVIGRDELPGWFVALQLGIALIIFGLLLTAVVVVFAQIHHPAEVGRLRFRSPFARLSLWALVATFLVLVTGTLVGSSDPATACSGWPLCADLKATVSLQSWVHLGHRALVGATALIILRLLWQAWRTQRSQRAILTATTGAGVLFYGQILTGALMSTRGFPIELLGLHQATSTAVWGALVILAVSVGIAGSRTRNGAMQASQSVSRKQRLRDLVSLTKPIIVALLLVTTFTGMVVGGKELPSITLTAWTLFAGALAAGGSGAINQYIDRELDQRMTRTANRPIASGRMTPAEGLAFGLALLLISFYLFAGFVNLLAALLSLTGMLYYVLLYSIFLKKATVQNIVIGGGAGAIPPLVGWAAATGSLNIPALFLFAIIFMWTPPHFWALALVRTKEYARAGVPMMPVVHGKKATRLKIFIYTLELVTLTLLMPILKITGSIFLVFAAALGGWLIFTAWSLWKRGGNKVAWKMYRYSSMYLAFLFVALMVDALI